LPSLLFRSAGLLFNRARGKFSLGLLLARFTKEDEIMKNIQSKTGILAILIVAIPLLVSLFCFTSHAPAADELIFIRLTDQLPTYDTHAEWYSIDGKSCPEDTTITPHPTDPSIKVDRYQLVYESPIWHHPPLANYLAYPVVKLLFNEYNEYTVRNSVFMLRQFAWAIFAFCIIATALLVKKTIKNKKFLPLALAPMVLCSQFFLQGGNNWFYHDMFLLAFLVIALYLRTSPRYGKFIYIPLAMMVACKIYGVLFLIPFIIENRKTALCSLALVPYLIQVYIVTGNPFHLITHWYQAGFNAYATGVGDFDFLLFLRRFFWEDIPKALRVALPFSLLAIPLTFYAIRLRFKRKISTFYLLLFGIIIFINLAWGVYYYQMIPFLFVTPLLLADVLNARTVEKAVG